MNTRFHTMISSVAASFIVRAFDPGKAGWKLTADGKGVELKDGNPVWIDANGGEAVVQGDTIARLNGEARDNRKRAEDAEKALATFKDIDPKKAKDAIEMLAKIDQKKLIDAGEVDKVRSEIQNQYTAQIAEKDKSISTLRSDLDNLRVNNVFANSEFIRNEVAMPRDFFEAANRQYFKVNPDNGKVEVYGRDGNRLFSKKNSGEYADPEEGLEILVNTHPQKDTILKAPNKSGSGNNGNGGNRNGVRSVRRSEFDQLLPAEQAKVAADARAGTVNLID